MSGTIGTVRAAPSTLMMESLVSLVRKLKPGFRRSDDAPLRTDGITHAESFRLMVSSLTDYAIFLLDPGGNIQTWNPGAERIKGYAAKEIIGAHFSRFYTSGDLRLSKPVELLELTRERGRAKVEGWRVRKDGSRFWADILITALRNDDGTLRGFAKITRDLTERRRSDEMLRSVVDHVIDGIITIDQQARIQSFNRSAERIFGYTSAEVIGRNVRVLMPDPYHGEHDDHVHNYLSTGQPKIIGMGREVLGRRKDGSTFPMDLAVSTFVLADQEFVTGIVRDISERKALEAQLRSRIEELALADRQKNEFLAMLGHELRNPLAPIKNAVQLMRMPGADADMIQRARSTMERQLHHLVRLVDDLLDVSRIITGRIELQRTVIDLSDVVTRAMETAQPVIDANGHDLEVDVPPGTHWINGDMVRLSQAVANLLTNAAKYTENPGLIRMTATRQGDQVALSVRDEGIGLAPDLIPRVFDLFVQADASLSRSKGGLGIGLTLVKQLVEMHDGEVEVQSNGPGLGSEFTVRLPLSLEAPARTFDEDNAARPRVTDALLRRVLVVDDNVDAADTIAMILRLAGFHVRCVHDGLGALRAAREYRPEAIVLDIGLPDMNGYEVAKRLRQMRGLEKTPIVAVTGYGQQNDRQLSAEAGIDWHLTKPVDASALQEILARP